MKDREKTVSKKQEREVKAMKEIAKTFEELAKARGWRNALGVFAILTLLIFATGCDNAARMLDCTDGCSVKQGADGINGIDGTDGANGEDGADGANGAPGRDADILGFRLYGLCATSDIILVHNSSLTPGGNTKTFMSLIQTPNKNFYRFRVENRDIVTRSFQLNFTCSASKTVELAPGTSFWAAVEVPALNGNCVLTLLVDGVSKGTATASVQGAIDQMKVVTQAGAGCQ